MYKLKGLQVDLVQEYGYGWSIKVHISGDDIQRARKIVDDLRGQAVSVSVDKWTESRSLRANAYFHALVQDIAEKVGVGFDEVKSDLVCNYGAQMYRDGAPIFINLPKGTSPASCGIKYYRWFADDQIRGVDVDSYIVYRGTHTYNVQEMQRLIDGAEQEARAVGLEAKLISANENGAMMRRYESEHASEADPAGRQA